MANVLLDVPDALLARVEKALSDLNGPVTGRPGKYALTKAEREEAATLSVTLGSEAAKAWIDSFLRRASEKVSRRAFIVQLLDIGLEHVVIEPKKDLPKPVSEKLLKQIEASQRKRGYLGAEK